MRRSRALARFVLVCATTAVPAVSRAQVPLTPMAPSGQTITPAFEGWYRNADGTFSLSFGYLNRNMVETVDVPVGENNFISPGAQNQGQPTHFDPRRHYGVFAVKVPADFGEGKVVWTLRFRGQTYAIPGNLRPDWEIDAIQGEASADNTPPAISFDAGAIQALGPLGITTGPMTVGSGKPFQINVLVKDDARAEPVAKAPNPVTLAWFKHQGAGDVSFSPATARLTPTGGTSSTLVTIREPGEYVLRVRGNDSAVAGAGHAQCCWTNAFVRVVVTP